MTYLKETLAFTIKQNLKKLLTMKAYENRNKIIKYNTTNHGYSAFSQCSFQLD